MSFSNPLFALALTLIAYEAAEYLFRASGQKAVFNPLLLAVLFVIPCVRAAGISYDTYFDGAKLIHFMLGPATVALAVPLYEQRQRVRASLVPLVASVASGSAVGIGLAGGLLATSGAARSLVISVAPKSVTTPISMAISERLGGVPALTAGVVLVTGIFGSVTVPTVLAALGRVTGERSDAARGFALGMSSHGAGVARAFQDGNEPGAFAGLAIGLNGLATAILVPCLIRWV